MSTGLSTVMLTDTLMETLTETPPAMLPALGDPALWFALLMAIGALLATGVGIRFARPALRSAGTFALGASLAGSVVAIGALAYALVARDFSLRYVASYTNLLLSRRHALSALWAGEAGALLYTVVALSACAVIASLVHRRAGGLQPVATATMTACVVAALMALRLHASPFLRLAAPPPEGRGLHPQLLHPAMLLQSPLLLLGLALLVVPFGYTVAIVLRGAHDHALAGDGRAHWRTIVQQWLVASWLLLTIALTLGLWWAQDQLGWFGFYFTWEPYASAPMLTWLAVTALLVVLVSEADRASDALWMAAFVVFAFLLAVAAIVRLRGGIAVSIRAVDAAPSVFLLVMGAAGLLLVGLVGAVASRRAGGAVPTRVSLGGKVVLLGTLLSGLGLAASHWRRDSAQSIDIGQVITAQDPFGTTWRFTSQGLSSYEEPDHTVLAVGVTAVRGRQRLGLLNSRQRQYFDARDNTTFEPSTTVGALSSWRETVSLGFLGPIDRTTAAVRITFVPLVSLLWLGVATCGAGMLLAAWPAAGTRVSATAT